MSMSCCQGELCPLNSEEEERIQQCMETNEEQEPIRNKNLIKVEQAKNMQLQKWKLLKD